MNAVVTTDTIEALQREMDQAHGVFSDRHAETESAERKLQAVAQRLAALNARRRAVGRTAESLVQTFVQSLTNDPAIKIDASKITVAREEAAILDTAMARLRIWGYADAQASHLKALVEEAAAQFEFEARRLNHHEAKVAALLGSAAELDGGLELAGPGHITEQLREIVADCRDKLTRARETLRNFEKEMADARARHESEKA